MKFSLNRVWDLAKPQVKSRIQALFLAFFFFPVGFHRFYLGKPVTGGLMLLIFSVFLFKMDYKAGIYLWFVLGGVFSYLILASANIFTMVVWGLFTLAVFKLPAAVVAGKFLFLYAITLPSFKNELPVNLDMLFAFLMAWGLLDFILIGFNKLKPVPNVGQDYQYSWHQNQDMEGPLPIFGTAVIFTVTLFLNGRYF